MKAPSRVLSYARSLIDLRGIILCAALGELIVIYVWVARWYEQFGDGPSGADPRHLLELPLLLVAAAVLLLLDKWWAYVAAALIGAWVLYIPGYLSMVSVGAAHSITPFGPAALRRWFIQKYVGQPQNFLELALAIAVLSYSALSLRKRRRDDSTSPGDSPWSRVPT
jgi:hypothetical protein